MDKALKIEILDTLNDMLNGIISHLDYGVCLNLSEIWADSYCWIEDNAHRWEEFSGDTKHSIAITDNAERDYVSGNLYIGEHGAKRFRFIHWMIEEITKIETID